MTRALRARVGATLAALAVAAASTLSLNVAVAAEEPLRLETGHIDLFNLHLTDNNEVGLNLKEDVTGSHVQHEPDDFELVVKADALTKNVPANGVPAGVPAESFYYLPLTQDHNLVWPGWDSLGVQNVYGTNLKAEINVMSVEGPGEISVWTNGTFGGPGPLMKENKYQFPGTITQDMAAHAHANWAFSAPGTYTLKVQAKVTSADGKLTSTTEVETYTIVVEPAPTSVSVTGAEAKVAEGDSVTLTAQQNPADPGFRKYNWEKRSNGGAWTTVEAGATAPAATLNVTAAKGDEYRVTVAGGKDYATNAPLSVTSEPVVIKVAEPAAEPSAPENTDPTAPEESEPAETEGPEASETSQPETSAPEPTDETSAPESTDDELPEGPGPTVSVTSTPGGSDGGNGGDNGAGNDGAAPGVGDAERARAAGGPADGQPEGNAAAVGATGPAGGAASGNKLPETGAQPMLPIAAAAAVMAAAGVLLRRSAAVTK